MTSANIKLAKASFVLIMISVLGYALSIYKEMLVASSFGIAQSVDAFYSALTVSNLAGNVLLSPFSTLFIPIFIRQLLIDKREANMLASVVINYLFAALLVLTVGVSLFAHPVISLAFRGLSPATTLITARILQVLSVTIICMGAVGVITGIMNSFEKFSAPALSQVVINVCIILFIMLLGKHIGIFALVWGQTIGFVIQVLILVYFVRRTGFQYFFTFKLRQPPLKGLFGFLLVYFFLSIVFLGNGLVNRAMASYLAVGSIAALAYADKLIQVPMIIFAGSISTVIYPFLARQFAENDLEQLKDTFASGVKMSGFFFIPTAVFIMIFSRPLIYILFQRGVFDARATELTSILLVCYSFQLFYAFISAIMIKVFFTVQDFVSILKVSAAGLTMTVVFNALLMKVMQPPAAGIALSASLSGFIVCLLYFYYLKKKITNMRGISIALFLLKISFVAGIAGTALKIIYFFLGKIFMISLLSQIFIVSFCSALGLVMFIGLALLFRIQEINRFYGLLSNWWQSRMGAVREN